MVHKINVRGVLLERWRMEYASSVQVKECSRRLPNFVPLTCPRIVFVYILALEALFAKNQYIPYPIAEDANPNQTPRSFASFPTQFYFS